MNAVIQFQSANQVVKAIMKGQSFVKVSNFEYCLGNAQLVVFGTTIFKIVLDGNIKGMTDYSGSAEGNLLAEKVVANAVEQPKAAEAQTPKAKITREGNEIYIEYKGSSISLSIRKSKYGDTYMNVFVRGDKNLIPTVVNTVKKQWSDVPSQWAIIG